MYVLAIIHGMLNKRESRPALEKRFGKWKVLMVRNCVRKLQHRQERNAERIASLLRYYAEENGSFYRCFWTLSEFHLHPWKWDHSTPR